MADITRDTNHDLLMRLITNPEAHLVRVHGNGFLQVDLDSTRRVHIWDPRLPRQRVYTLIHSHRFDFSSTVLMGSIEHLIYDVRSHTSGEYQNFEPVVRKDEDTVLELAHYGRYNAVLLGGQHLLEGTTYSFSAYAYHETKDVELAVTMMEKTQVYPNNPRILVPFGETPDNDFNRYDWSDDEAVQTSFFEAIEGLRERWSQGKFEV